MALDWTSEAAEFLLGFDTVADEVEEVMEEVVLGFDPDPDVDADAGRVAVFATILRARFLSWMTAKIGEEDM